MFGVMGTSAAFAQAACAKKQQGNKIIMLSPSNNTTISNISCSGEIVVKYKENAPSGAIIKDIYTDLDNAELIINASSWYPIEIKGNVTTLVLSGQPIVSISTECDTMSMLSLNGCGIGTIDLSYMPNLSYLDLSQTGITELDLSNNHLLSTVIVSDTPLVVGDFSGLQNLSSIQFANCAEMTRFVLNNSSINQFTFQGNDALTEVEIVDTQLSGNIYGSIDNLATVKCTANSAALAGVLASLIQGSTVQDGVLYCNSTDEYYQDLANAIEGTTSWTIQPLS